MRVFFSILKASEKSAEVYFTGPSLDDVLGVSVLATKEDGVFKIDRFSFSRPHPETNKVIKNLQDAPLSSLQELIEHLQEFGGARQIVWDPRLDKYRNVTTMKDDENMYSSVGLEEPIVVSSKDEKMAARKIQQKVTQLMVDAPESAAELSQWFAEGRQIKEVQSGKTPEAIPLASICNEGAEPKQVVLRPRKKKVGKNKA